MILPILLTVAAQGGVPEKHIPPEVMLEVRLIDRQFTAALHRDCATDKCFSSGCTYGDHITVDRPRTSSLPGLVTENEGPGSVAPQDYLTLARCSFSHERKVRQRDVNSLKRRLEMQLSRGWLKVEVTPQKLDPVPKRLSELAPEPEDKPKEEPKPEEVKPEAPKEPEVLDGDKALLEMWRSLVPHFPWMIAIFLATLATLVLIWAARRLGAKSLEERMLEAQMANGELETPEIDLPESEEETALEVKKDGDLSSRSGDTDFADEQERIWNDRIVRVSTEDDNIVTQLLREWLKAGEFPLLARALLLFGERVLQAFDKPSEESRAEQHDLALKKVEFAEFFKNIDEHDLPSRAAFFRKLNQQAMASAMLSQSDVRLYRALREDFGSGGVLNLMKTLPARYAAVLFALVERPTQLDVARRMSAKLRVNVADQLLQSTRISRVESKYILESVEAAQEGSQLPTAPTTREVADRGPEVDGAAALSVLMPMLSEEQRQILFQRALERSGGDALPTWYEDIFFNHMLSGLDPGTRNDLLLDVDVRGLAAWLSLQPSDWRSTFVGSLSDALRNALRAAGTFGSREEQMRLAAEGQRDLVRAIKSLYARDEVRFVDLVTSEGEPIEDQTVVD